MHVHSPKVVRSGNGEGQLGQPLTTTESILPIKIPGVSGVKDLEGDAFKTCFIDANDAVQCMGRIGVGTFNAFVGSTPTLIPGMTDIRTLSMSSGSMCGLTNSGQVVCRGNDTAGQTGQGTTVTAFTDSAQPLVGLPTSITVVQLVSANATYCVRDTDGDVYCWGSNPYGEVGLPSTVVGYGTAQKVTAISDSGLLAGNSGSFCSLSTTKELKCWGNNGRGNLGQGTVTPSESEDPLPALAGLEIEDFLFRNGSGVSCARTTSGKKLLLVF